MWLISEILFFSSKNNPTNTSWRGNSYSSDLWCDSSQILSCTFPDVLGTLQSWMSLGVGWVSSCCSSDLVFPSSSRAPHRQRWDVNETVQEGAHQICSALLSLLFCCTVQKQQQPQCSWPIICSQQFPLLLFFLLLFHLIWISAPPPPFPLLFFTYSFISVTLGCSQLLCT